MVTSLKENPSACFLQCWCLIIILALSVGLLGCSATRETSKSPRTTIEQLLISQSIDRALTVAPDFIAPKGSATVEVAGLNYDKRFAGDLVVDASNYDKMFAKDLVVEWLRQQGWQITATGGTYVVHLIIYALGTEQENSFLGLPPASSTLIPISLPELALYKASRQRGYARFSLTVSERPSERLITSTPVMEGDVYFNQYTVLFAFTFHTTDIAPPPP